MPIDLAALTGIRPNPLTPPSGGTSEGEGGSSFAGQLGKLIEGVEQASADANQAVVGMVEKTTDVHDAMIALQRAELTLQLTVQIRNKLVQAYNDIMRMPV